MNLLNRTQSSDNEFRDNGRFTIKNPHLWEVKVGGKTLPITWLENISPNGMQIRGGLINSLEVGEQTQVILRHRGTNLLAVDANVRWRNRSSIHINMYCLGLSFNEPTQQLIDLWKRENLLSEMSRILKQKDAGEGQGSHLPLLNFASTIVPWLPLAAAWFAAGYIFGR